MAMMAAMKKVLSPISDTRIMPHDLRKPCWFWEEGGEGGNRGILSGGLFRLFSLPQFRHPCPCTPSRQCRLHQARALAGRESADGPEAGNATTHTPIKHSPPSAQHTHLGRPVQQRHRRVQEAVAGGGVARYGGWGARGGVERER